jgi:hypothetical protein
VNLLPDVASFAHTRALAQLLPERIARVTRAKELLSEIRDSAEFLKESILSECGDLGLGALEVELKALLQRLEAGGVESEAVSRVVDCLGKVNERSWRLAGRAGATTRLWRSLCESGVRPGLSEAVEGAKERAALEGGVLDELAKAVEAAVEASVSKDVDPAVEAAFAAFDKCVWNVKPVGLRDPIGVILGEKAKVIYEHVFLDKGGDARYWTEALCDGNSLDLSAKGGHLWTDVTLRRRKISEAWSREGSAAASVPGLDLSEEGLRKVCPLLLEFKVFNELRVVNEGEVFVDPENGTTPWEWSRAYLGRSEEWGESVEVASGAAGRTEWVPAGSGGPSGHVVVVIGGGKKDGKDWLVVQNFWELSQFFAVSLEYLERIGAAIIFVANKEDLPLRLGKGSVRFDSPLETFVSSRLTGPPSYPIY